MQAEIPSIDTKTIKAGDYDLEAAKFYHDAYIRHLGMVGYGSYEWERLTPKMRNALGLATADFMRRYVCAG